MTPPDNTELFETPISTHWFDEYGIFCAVSKKIERSISHYEKVMELYTMVSKDGNKLCLLSDATNTMPMSEEVRDYVTTQMPLYIKAHAIISETKMDNTLNKTLIKLAFNGFPIQLFPTEEEAKAWLKDYL